MQKKWWALGGYSCRKAVLNDPGFAKSAPFAADFLNSMAIVKDFWAEPSYAELLLAMQKRVHDYVVADKGTAKEALDLLVKDWTEGLQGRRQDLADESVDLPPGHRARAGAGHLRALPVASRDERMLDRTPQARSPSGPRPDARRLIAQACAGCPTGRSPGCSSRRPSLLLLAINIFPLIWTIRLSFTNYRANRPNAPLQMARPRATTRDMLTDPDIWHGMQVTAHFVVWTIALQTLLGFALAYLIDRKFRGHGFWTTVILIPMMLSPAVVGNFWTFLYQPQIGLFNYVVSFFTGIDPSSFQMIGDVHAGALVDHHRRHLDVDALRDADLPCGPALDPRLHLRGGRGRPRLELAAVLVDHAADGAALHHARGAVPRHRELQDVRHGQPADLRRPGLDHRARLDHPEARGLREMATGYSSAFAIILFVTVFGLANIYVKALNRVKQR